MARQRGGKILTSVRLVHCVSADSVHYAMTRGGEWLYEMLSREAANFRCSVNAIAAGIFDTDLGQTIARAFSSRPIWVGARRNVLATLKNWPNSPAFMASDRNSYMTGEIVLSTRTIT